MKNFWSFYREIITSGLNEFIKKHPRHKHKTKVKEAVSLLQDSDYEGPEVQSIYQGYEGAEDELNDSDEIHACELHGYIHDSIIDFLIDQYDVKLEGEEVGEITNSIVKSEKVKKFVSDWNKEKEKSETEED